jgi:uncharacterized protein (TIGR00251 family)
MRSFTRLFAWYRSLADEALSMDFVERRAEGVVLRIRLQPRASRDAVIGESGGRLRVSVTAPPVEDAANEAVVKYISKTLGVSKSSVQLLRGKKAREKDFLIQGADAEAIRSTLLP